MIASGFSFGSAYIPSKNATLPRLMSSKSTWSCSSMSTQALLTRFTRHLPVDAAIRSTRSASTVCGSVSRRDDPRSMMLSSSLPLRRAMDAPRYTRHNSARAILSRSGTFSKAPRGVLRVRRRRALLRDDALPIHTALKSGGGSVYCLLLKSLRHQHHPDGQPVNHATGHTHRWVVRAVELGRVGQHLEAALQHFRDRCIGPWQRSGDDR